jgi:hypothetical protein
VCTPSPPSRSRLGVEALPSCGSSRDSLTCLSVCVCYWGSYHNVHTLVPFLQEPPLSRPGAWAYADGMELGRMSGPFERDEDRTIFGWYVITSSPLILGHNISDDATNDRVWDVVSNVEAISINQQVRTGPHTHMGLTSQMAAALKKRSICRARMSCSLFDYGCARARCAVARASRQAGQNLGAAQLPTPAAESLVDRPRGLQRHVRLGRPVAARLGVRPRERITARPAAVEPNQRWSWPRPHLAAAVHGQEGSGTPGVSILCCPL